MHGAELMQVARETIILALLDQAASAASFRTVGRRLKFPEDAPEQPALFVRYLKDEYPARPTGILPKIIMEAELWIYCQSGNDPDTAPDSVLNPLIDAIEQSLAPSPATGVQDLGGLVVHCWIEGGIEKNPGDLDNQAMAVIPVKILAP